VRAEAGDAAAQAAAGSGPPPAQTAAAVNAALRQYDALMREVNALVPGR
jgi:hypothetical protein